MKRKKIVMLLILISLWICVSCGKGTQAANDNIPGVTVPLDQMNTKIQLQIGAPQLKEVHKNNELLLLVVRNLTDTPIVFSSDLGTKIYYKRGASWERITNKMGYSTGKIILQPEKFGPGGESTPITPSISSLTEPTTIRVVVEGTIKDTNQLVGSYMDVVLQP